ncbi:MAG: hypothetical protein KF782_34005 [Labilithrix sp.]|nr:hypothetical protein [Labilithrix sp.]
MRRWLAMMIETRKNVRIRAGHAVLVVVSAAAAAVACGSEPKREPTVATVPTDTAPASPQATPEVEADAGGPAKPDKQAECDALLDEANAELDAERIAVDKLCKKDADCTPIKGRACGFACVTGAIPKSEEKEWNDTVQKVTDTQCKKWNEQDCASLRTKPPPTCQERKVWCDKGHCALKEK